MGFSVQRSPSENVAKSFRFNSHLMGVSVLAEDQVDIRNARKL